MKRVIRLHFRPILYSLYSSYNVTTCPGNKKFNYLSHCGDFTRNTYATKTHAHKAVLIPPMYTTSTLHFKLCQFTVVTGYFLVQDEVSKM